MRAGAFPLRWVVLLTVTYSTVAMVALRPVTDPDIWWHLRTATWIVEHKAVPTTDPFSLDGSGKPWVAYSWLFELLVLSLYRAFGLVGILIYAVVGSVGAVLALQGLVPRSVRTPLALALTVAGTVALVPVLAWPRSYLLSIVLYTVELQLLLNARETGRTRPLLLLPPLIALWANLHIQFVYGLFALALAAAEPVIERWFPEGLVEPRSRLGSRPLAAILLACVAASLATPYHVWIYRPVVEYVTQAGAFDLIRDLQAPAFRWLPDWSMLALTLAAAFTLGKRGTFPVFPTLLLGSAVFVSFRASRDVWFVVVAALAIVAAGHAWTTAPAYRLTAAQLVVALLATGCVAAAFGVFKGLSPRYLDAEVRKVFPEVAASVVADRGYRGPLYNTFGWGGYLIWRLPTLPVSMDGRSNLYGPDKIRRSVETWSGLPGWDSDPDLVSAGVVIASPRVALGELLRRDGRFRLAYEDDVALVFVARR